MHFRSPAAFLLAAAMVATLPVLPGCGPHLGGYDYNAGEARQSFSVYYGTATNVQEVNINSQSDTKQTVGAVIGAVAGGVIGSTIGSGSGRTLATVGVAFMGVAQGLGVPLPVTAGAICVGAFFGDKVSPCPTPPCWSPASPTCPWWRASSTPCSPPARPGSSP